MPMSGACRAEKGRGLEAQLCLENSSPDIYDYDGPSLVDLLRNINKLNRLQIIMTTEFKPQTVVRGKGRLSVSSLILLSQCSGLSIVAWWTAWPLVAKN